LEGKNLGIFNQIITWKENTQILINSIRGSSHLKINLFSFKDCSNNKRNLGSSFEVFLNFYSNKMFNLKKDFNNKTISTPQKYSMECYKNTNRAKRVCRDSDSLCLYWT